MTQLNQSHYLALARDLGIVFRGRPTTWDIYQAIRAEIQHIHNSIAVLYPPESETTAAHEYGMSAIACQKRLGKLHRAANAQRAQEKAPK